MPVYNGERYIREAVQSVLRQTITSWELIIVDDASTDSTGKILESFKDSRVKIIKNRENSGSVVSRNVAFAQIRSEYVAILDADDRAMPTRFEEQVRFLDTHPDFGLVGAWAKIIDENGKSLGRVVRELIPSEKIPIKLLFHNVLAFSSVMMRKSAMPPMPFDEKTVPVEDVALYLKMLPRGKFGILPKVLVCYRSHSKGISKVYNDKRREVMDRLITEQLKNLGLTPSAEEVKIHRTNYGYEGNDLLEFLKKRETWLEKLIDRNRKTEIYPKKLFEEVVAEKWLESCDANARLGLKTWKMFRNSPLSEKIAWLRDGKKLSRLWLKCAVSRDKI